MTLIQKLLVAVVVLGAYAAVPAGNAAAATHFLVAQAAGTPLSGTPEPTEEPTTSPSDSIVAAAAVGPEWSAYTKIVENATNFITTVVNHEDNGTTSFTKTFKLSSIKPKYARCEIIAGDGLGGVAIWHGGAFVQAHEGGPHKDIVVTLPRHNRAVTDLLGYGCGDTTPDRVPGYATHNGKLTETAGPTINGNPTDVVSWYPNPGDQVKLAREDFYISKTTHLIVASKGYFGEKLFQVEDSIWDIQVDPGLNYDIFDINK